jgi:hypothetical protein
MPAFAGMTPEKSLKLAPMGSSPGQAFSGSCSKADPASILRRPRTFLHLLPRAGAPSWIGRHRFPSQAAQLTGTPWRIEGLSALREGSLLAPLADRSPIHSHPPIDGSADDKQRRFSRHAAICLARLTFGNARSIQCHAPRRLVRSFCTVSDIGRGHAHRARLPQLGDRTWWQIATLIQNNSGPPIGLAARPVAG